MGACRGSCGMHDFFSVGRSVGRFLAPRPESLVPWAGTSFPRIFLFLFCRTVQCTSRIEQGTRLNATRASEFADEKQDGWMDGIRDGLCVRVSAKEGRLRSGMQVRSDMRTGCGTDCDGSNTVKDNGERPRRKGFLNS